MYSVVLLAAITAGSASPDCCFFGGGGWGGCYGAAHGYGCYGCYGCYGGCYGYYGYSGNYGWAGSSWGGSGGGWGGCYGGGCYGCYGGCYGCYGGCGGCYGVSTYGYGGGVYGGGVVPYSDAAPMAPAGGTPVMPAPAPEKISPPKVGGEQTRAKVTIDVPAQARLYIDGQAMPDKSGKRTFVTPPLQAGQTYFYDVKLEVVQNGQTQVQSTRVILHPGEVVAATFNGTTNGTAVAASNEQ
jgi:uncharacterized protein (TIGR03000 family)